MRERVAGSNNVPGTRVEIAGGREKQRWNEHTNEKRDGREEAMKAQTLQGKMHGRERTTTTWTYQGGRDGEGNDEERNKAEEAAMFHVMTGQFGGS
ncbi:hypothetical protein NDU88_008044 [Pleurodeles waltl]|uniref:Uncharacterized protein n=1 Tax=Pleurodeles waltl TaxID=8319 RepID=A0AAV7N569_PLEWA|nr:hypothetical protein NDU88_008044 [Pleurodeles waltl]